MLGYGWISTILGKGLPNFESRNSLATIDVLRSGWVGLKQNVQLTFCVAIWVWMSPLSDWMVQKIIFTEAIIHKWSSLSILLILHLMVLANLYYKDIGSTQTFIFVPKTVFHFLHYSQQSLHHLYFLQFSLISVPPPHFYLSLWNPQIAQVTDVPGQLSSH